MKPLVILTLALSTLVSADTIRLKNGRTISADSVRQADGRVEYTLGEDTYSIPSALVERIDTGSVPRGSGTVKVAEIAPPAEAELPAPASLSEVVRNGRVDEDALAALERGNDPRLAAAGLFRAAKFESDRENFDAARNYLQRALFALPDTPTLMVHYAYVLLRMNRTAEALSQAEPAARLAPRSADAQQILGATYYAADRLPEAIAAWKRSLALRPNASVEAQLAKAEREAAAERSFEQQHSRHFSLRYEGSAVPEGLRREVLRALDQHYEDLVRAFGVAPREAIGVVLYTDQTFFNVTQAPSWAGALYDGKLRLPVGGLGGMTAELSRSLRHELAHSFIHQITRGRCPTWLNEGLAMLLEDRSSGRNGRQLARLFAAGAHVPYNMLESDFVNLRADQADVAYAQSLAAVEFIHRTYGMNDVVRVLQRIGEGSGNEAALRATLRLGYAQLERDVGEYLKRTYGD